MMARAFDFRRLKIRFPAELIEVSLSPLKGCPSQIPKDGGIGQNAR